MTHAKHAPDFIHPVAGGVYDHLTCDITISGMDNKLASRLAVDLFDRIETLHFGACLACLTG